MALHGLNRKPRKEKKEKAEDKPKLIKRPLKAKTLEQCFANPIIQVGIKEPGVMQCRMGEIFPRDNEPCFCMRERFRYG